MTSLNKRAVAQVLANKPDDYVRQLLELRRDAARASVNKFKRMLCLRVASRRSHARHAAHVWRRSRALVRARAAIAEPEEERKRPAALAWSIRSAPAIVPASPHYGNPLALLGDISRAALCAAPGMS